MKSLWRLLLSVKTNPVPIQDRGTQQDGSFRDTDHSPKTCQNNSGGAQEPDVLAAASQEGSCCNGAGAEEKHSTANSSPGGDGCSSNACQCTAKTAASEPLVTAGISPSRGKVLFGSQKGTSSTFAGQLAEQAAAQGVQLAVMDLGVFEVEQLWKEQLVIIVTSTYEDGTPPNNAR